MKAISSNVKTPKRHSKTLRRARLLDLLHNNLHRKLTFICAPAGYGKTTLLTDLAEDISADIYWYQIGLEESDLQSFFQNLIQAFQQKSPQFGEALMQLANAGHQQPRALAGAMANEIEAVIDDYSVLVLDDYHHVSDENSIVEFIDRLLELLPDKLRLMIGSRNVFGIPTATLYIQEQLAIIGDEDLKFRSEELKDLCLHYYHIQLTDPQAQQIIEESEGWIVSILLALRTKNTTIEIPKILGAKEHVYSYLADEVIQSQPKQLIEFMLGTSIVDQFDIPFANHLLEISDGQQRIKQLEDLNLFLTNVESGDEKVYRYHQLFAEFLQGHLGENRQEDLKKYHQRAGIWYQNADIPEKAVSHFLAANQIIEAGETIDMYAKEMFLAGKTNLLMAWYEEISTYPEVESVIANLILYIAKWHINLSNFIASEELIILAEPHLKIREDKNHYANLLITKATCYHYLGRYKEAFDLATQTQKLTKKNKLSIHFHHQAERLLGMTSHYLGETKAAITYLKNAAQGLRNQLENQSTKPDNLLTHDLIITLIDIGYFSFPEGGDVYTAQKSIREAVDLSKKVRNNYSDIAMTHNNYASLLFRLGNYQDAWLYYVQAIEAAKLQQNKAYQAHIMNGQADVLRHIEELETARELYEESIKLAEPINEKYALAASYLGLVDIEYQTGSFNQALYYLREVARIQQGDIDQPEYQIGMAKIYLAMGQIDLARKTYEKIFSDWDKINDPLQEVIDGYYHYGLTLFQLEEKSMAANLIKKGLELTATLGYDEFLVSAVRRDLDLLQFISKEWDSPQVLSLLKRANQTPPKKESLVLPEVEPEEVAVNLQVTAFGSGTVRLDNEIIPNSAWLSVGARAMFYFILNHKKPTKDIIALEFWPDFSSGKVNSNFHATLWRVRNALGGKHMIQFNQNIYQINPEADIYYDVDQFENIRERLNNSESKTEKRSFLRQLVELYQDDFLPGIDMEWADSRRHILQIQYSEILDQLSDIEMDHQNYPEAEMILERLIKLNPFQDHNHLKLMKCLIAQNKSQVAHRHYKKYIKRLSDEMGIEPTEELSSYHKSL